MRFLGIDIGSSFVKLSVLDGHTGKSIATAQFPDKEQEILSLQEGWAEQDPNVWWECIQKSCHQLFTVEGIDPNSIEAIGIAYQMHGLVMVDQNQDLIHPAIIWCDSRAVAIGEDALSNLGENYCFSHLLNSPGNFTAAKLQWVQENKPEVFKKIHKIMLPGDYIAMKLTGELTTTCSGLSEGTLWDFKNRSLANNLLDNWEISSKLIPKLVSSFGEQGVLCPKAAQALGLPEGIKVSYRGGDQPNNAFSLNVLEPGEIAATAGTSGVIYAVSDKLIADKDSRVNTFLHVNDTKDKPRNGILLCINGAGRSYAWLRQLLNSAENTIQYDMLNSLSMQAPIGSKGLIFHPFGNGAERLFQNKVLGAQFKNIDLNQHSLSHLVRATKEGIVFAMNKGFDVLKSLGGRCEVIKVAQGNLFLSEEFGKMFVNTTGTAVELYRTDGAEGAARGAAIGCGFFSSAAEAFVGLESATVIEPSSDLVAQYKESYQQWLLTLEDNNIE